MEIEKVEDYLIMAKKLLENTENKTQLENKISFLESRVISLEFQVNQLKQETQALQTGNNNCYHSWQSLTSHEVECIYCRKKAIPIIK